MRLKKSLKKTGKVFVTLIIALTAVVSIWFFVCSATGKLPMLFGYGVVRIQTGSMEPNIPAGTFILIKATNPNDIVKGDIITFKSDSPEIKGFANTHRVEGVYKDGAGGLEFITKGDANLIMDSVNARASNVYGRYVKNLAFLTFVYGLLSKAYIFWPLIILIAAFVVFSYVSDFRKYSKSKNRENLKRLVEIEVEKLKQEEQTGGSDQSEDI